MNERIRELAEQAGFKYIKDEGIGWAGNYNASLPKFAELIVRECCIALNPMLRDMISRGQGREIILQHFGIDPKEITTRMLDTAIAQMEKQLAKTKSGEE